VSPAFRAATVPRSRHRRHHPPGGLPLPCPSVDSVADPPSRPATLPKTRLAGLRVRPLPYTNHRSPRLFLPPPPRQRAGRTRGGRVGEWTRRQAASRAAAASLRDSPGPYGAWGRPRRRVVAGGELEGWCGRGWPGAHASSTLLRAFGSRQDARDRTTAEVVDTPAGRGGSCQVPSVRGRITSGLRIPSSRRLRPLLNREILTVARLRLRFRSIVAAKSNANLGAKTGSYSSANPKRIFSDELSREGARQEVVMDTSAASYPWPG